MVGSNWRFARSGQAGQRLLGRLLALAAMVAVLAGGQAMAATWVGAPDRAQGEGLGPFKRLVIRGVTVIDGTGAPATGPMDVVIEGNRIADVRAAGTPGEPLAEQRPPRDFDHEIDATGMYLLPGFVDTHSHGPDTSKAEDMSYAYKLWLAHGVTAIRAITLADAETSRREKRRSAANAIAAPRIFNYQTVGAGWSGGRIDSPEKARAWARWAAANEIDGIKLFNRGDETPEITAAAIDEARKLGLDTVAHLSQNNVAGFNAFDAAEAGLETVTHFYGHFESLLRDGRLQRYPAGHNQADEGMRFGRVPLIRHQVWEPGSEPWKAYLRHQLEHRVIFDPTFNIYSASRDLSRARTSEWHDAYTTPRLLRFFESTRSNHGSYFYDWTSENEFEWKRFYRLYQQLVADYHGMGGSVTVGTDPGFIWKTWGFSYVEELELLREAGLSPLEIIHAATAEGAAAIHRSKGEPAPFGTVKRGMLADLVLVPEDPLANLKVLYGMGHLRLNDEKGVQERVGGVRYTIKDGIVYDARALLADVAAMVAREKQGRAP